MKEINEQTNWCIKVDESNIEFLKEKRHHSCVKGYINHHLNDGIKNFWNWSSDLPKDCVLITFEQFKKYILKDKTYPTSLETVKFKYEPGKSLGFVDIDSIKQDLIDKEAKRQTQKAFDFGMNYGMSSQKLNEVIKDTLNGNDFSQSDATDAVDASYKWEELPKKMLAKTEMYDLMSKDLTYTFETMSKLSSEFPLTPKDCYTALPDMIYVKKIKNILKMKIDDIKSEFESINDDTSFEDYKKVLQFRCVQFCRFILDIKDPESKKEKDPNKLFDKYLESL